VLPGRPTLAAFALAVATATALAGCGSDTGTSSPSPSPTASAPASPSASPSASPTPSKKPVPVSKNLNAIDVSGRFGKEPKVEFKAPFAIDQTRTRVLAPGDGPAIAATDAVTVDYYGVNGRTGKKFDDSFSRGEPATFPLDGVVPGFQKGLVGQKQGSRLLIAMPGSDGYDASGGSPQAGIEVGDTLLFVVDVVAVPLDGPKGTAVKPKAGLPTVTADDKNVPSVTMPAGEPPKGLVVQPLIKGSGPQVAATDTITMNYRWYTWRDGRLVEDSYATPEADTVALNTLFQGLQRGLAGQTVGSRVLLVVPPALSYPSGDPGKQIEKTDTQVLVVDLLFSQPGQ
jgi:peptidylprolyl isomerase